MLRWPTAHVFPAAAQPERGHPSPCGVGAASANCMALADMQDSGGGCKTELREANARYCRT